MWHGTNISRLSLISHGSKQVCLSRQCNARHCNHGYVSPGSCCKIAAVIRQRLHCANWQLYCNASAAVGCYL